MKKHINRITKQSWLVKEENGKEKKKIVYKTSCEGKTKYYYFKNDNNSQEVIYFKEAEFKELYFKNKYKQFKEKNLFLFKTIKVYQKDKNLIYAKKEITAKTDSALRIFAEDKVATYYNEEDKISSIYRDKKHKFHKKKYNNYKLHYVMVMHNQEFQLMKKRSEFVNEINEAFKNLVNSITFNNLEIELNETKLDELYKCRIKYNLSPNNTNNGKIDLVDEMSKPNFKPSTFSIYFFCN